MSEESLKIFTYDKQLKIFNPKILLGQIKTN